MMSDVRGPQFRYAPFRSRAFALLSSAAPIGIYASVSADVFITVQHVSLLSRNFHHDISLNHIIYLNIVEFFKYKTTLVTGIYFLYIVLETL